MIFFESEKKIFEKSDSKKIIGNFRFQKAQKRSFIEKLELSLQGTTFEFSCHLLEPIRFELWKTGPLTARNPYLVPIILQMGLKWEFWEISNFKIVKSTFLAAQEELEALLWICFTSRKVLLIFEEKTFFDFVFVEKKIRWKNVLNFFSRKNRKFKKLFFPRKKNENIFSSDFFSTKTKSKKFFLQKSKGLSLR